MICKDFQKPLPMFGDRVELSTSVEVYHAGMTAARRKKIQNNFMKGKLRIVIATFAFCMGINKADIRGIIHYNMPRTLEHYVQEIGRAGRDGLPARCHMFYDPQNRDEPELKRHIYRNSLDRSTIRKLLENVFPQYSCSNICSKHEIAFSVDSTCPSLAYVIAEHTNKKNTNIPTQLEFSVMEFADKIGWESGVIKSELKRCEWIQVYSKWKKTRIGVTFYDLGFNVRSPGNLNETQLDFALDAPYNRTISQERMALHQLNSCSSAFES